MPGKKVRKVRFKNAHELVDVEVGFLSFVDHGANRVPFRIEKRDQPEEGKAVIRMQIPFRKEEKAVKVGAIVISGDADLEVAKARIEAGGYTTDGMVELQGNRIFPQVEDLGEQEQHFLKFSDQAGAVLVNAKKFFTGVVDSVNFDDNLASAQFVPGLSMSMDALFKTVLNALEKAETNEELATMVTEATNAFSKAVGSMAGSIPMEAFKLEQGLAEQDEAPEKKEDTPAAGEGTEKSETKDADPDTPAGNEDGDQQVAKEDEGKADDADGDTSDDEGAGEVGKSDPAEEDGEKDSAVLKAIQDLKTELTTKVNEVAGQVQELGGEVAKATKAADEAKALAKAADETITATVGGVARSDQPAPGQVQKSGKRIPLMDTGVKRPD
jgi:hypothetical protein